MSRTVKDRLFEPIDIGNVTIRNRFVRSATHEWMCEEDGTPRSELGDVLEGLAKGGVGLIVTGYAYIDPKGKSMAGQNAMYEDRLIGPYARIVKRVHRHGAKILMQLVHGGRQAWVGGKAAGHLIGPSAVQNPETELEVREMSVEDIWGVIGAFVQGARRAYEAGFDGVQLHVAHGFLLSSFISPYTNRRTDNWGGSLENRARVIVEIIRKIRENVSSELPVTVKINSTDGFMDDDKGLQLADSVDIAKILAAEGLKAVEVSDGIYEAGASSSRKGIRDESLEGYFLEYASRFKAELDIPVICVGGMRSLTVMSRALSSGMCDMVSISRPLIREPDLVNRFASGRTTVAECISCNQCFDPTGIKCKIADQGPGPAKALPVVARTAIVRSGKALPVRRAVGAIALRTRAARKARRPRARPRARTGRKGTVVRTKAKQRKGPSRKRPSSRRSRRR